MPPRASRSRERRAARRSMGNELREHRVVAVRDLVALPDTGVDADVVWPRDDLEATRRGQEARVGILGVDARLDRVALGRRRLAQAEGHEGRPAAIRELVVDEVTPVTASVTGCSTWRRVFISRKKKSPASVTGTRRCRR